MYQEADGNRRQVVMRRATVLVFDLACWIVALILIKHTLQTLGVSRIGFTRDFPETGSGWVMLGVLFALQIGYGLRSGLYTGHWHRASYAEVSHLAIAVLGATVVAGFMQVWFHSVPVLLGACPVAFIAMMAGRLMWRFMLERSRPRSSGTRRLIVFGAGQAGEAVLHLLRSDPTSPYDVVALLDDDPHKQNLRLYGATVMGGRDYLAEAVARFNADCMLIALPSAEGPLVTELFDLGVSCGLEVRVLPQTSELLGRQVVASDIRELNDADLLGRRVLDTDTAAIGDYLQGKRVMVTGAGGSIGSELCKQLLGFEPEKLIMLDRDESALHALKLSLEAKALLNSDDLVLVDIRDREALWECMYAHRPHVVFHVAALKHLPLLENNPAEALKTNVWGTLNVLEAASVNFVERFINVSTDKVANPTSALGVSKRIAERMTADIAVRTGRPFLSVRFGNVLGSRGSVLDSFQAQLQGGHPITITHPEVTRYFMTVSEAAQLTIQAAAIGRGGEAMILDMGEPVRIVDLARRLAASSGKTAKIVFTGLRKGEKLHEDLVGDDEVLEATVHPSVRATSVPPLDASLARALPAYVSSEQVLEHMKELVEMPATSSLDVREIALEIR